ncbi:hypothetical protein [uncultured Jatrophihabitans sp.]|uniref:hypothetical protein n=1 Tax=uncultured Jatrophihabitans sp. TaxID=1610747 RepID=UPI0035C971A7
MTTSDDMLTAAFRQLYAAAPEDFLALRTHLAGQAKRAGDGDTARALAKARKPTVSAWVANAYALAHPDAVEQLRSLGEELRAAQDRLDTALLRELAGRRRALVQELTGAALRAAGRADPPAALRDEVSGTFDAALADDDVAARLGRLLRAEQWSGFGFSADAAPQLRLVPGGRGVPAERARNADGGDDPKQAAATKAGRKAAPKAAKTAAPKAAKSPKTSQTDEPPPARLSAAQRQAERRIAALQRDLDDVDAELAAARERESGARADADRAKRAVAAASAALDVAKRAVAAARIEQSDARRRRRTAQQQLDRAQRE